MKFMKLGTKPDAFQSEGNHVRYVASELPTDIIVDVGEVRFYVHKFPLLSKSNRFHKLVVEASEDSDDEVHMDDFPGGPKAFEICAKFCYGMAVTLSAYNVVAARCAAEFLEMTEEIERGNLIYKIDVFLNSSVFRSWKDSIIALQTARSSLPWSEDLRIVGRCIDSIASKASLDPSNVTWSYTYSKILSLADQIGEHGVPMDWWVEDLCDLDVDLYKRVMVAVKSKGRMSADVIGESLRAYIIKWLPNSVDILVSGDYIRKNRILVETIISLLPSDKFSGCSCSFLLKLLKVATLIGIKDSLKEELVDRISLQLDRASVKDLLIPARPPDDTVYDVHLVQSLVSRFVVHDTGTRSCGHVVKDDKVSDEFVLGHASLLTVGKLVDGCLAEIGCDPNLPLSTFVDLSRSLPASARPVHDGLYTAIDIYLQEHTSMMKEEKKRICSLMDVKKLSTDASEHAAQNERLPLRVVVQVLYFEQIRAAARRLELPSKGVLRGNARSTITGKEDWENPAAAPEQYKSLKKQLGSMKITGNETLSRENKNSRSCKERGGVFLLRSRSRRIFDRFWVGKAQVEEQNRSSETSASSQSPPTFGNPGEAKSSGSSSRQRRHSIS